MPAKLSKLAHIGAAKEATMGTPLVPTFYLPVRSFSPEHTTEPIRDESVRANAGAIQGIYPGVAASTFGLGGHPYQDTLGHLFVALGLRDTIGAPAGGLTPHTFKLTSPTPDSYTLTDFDGVEARAYPGCLLDELTFKVDVKGMADYEAKFVGWPSVAAATPVPAFSAVEPFLGWQLTWSAGGAASTRVQSAEWSFKRGAEVLYGSAGAQTPRETFADALAVSCKSTAIFEDLTDYNRFLSYAEHVLVGSLIQPAGRGGASLAIQMSRAVCHKATKDRGGKFVTADFEFEGSYSSTDAGPAQVTLNSTRATAF